MKDGTSAALDTVDSGGGSTSEGGGGGSTRSNSPDSSGMNTVSPPGTISPEAAALVSAAAVCNSYRQCSDEPVGPILNQATFSDMLNLRANILAPFLPLSLPGALTSGSSIFPHHHSIYSWAPTASSPSSIQMERTNSKHNNNNRMALRTTSSKKNNNNVVTSSSAAVTRKNQANTKKRGPRKTDPTEAAIIEVAAMTHIPDPEPLSPPTSGSSPPTDIVNSGQGTNVVVEKDAVAGREKVFTCRTCNRSFGYKHVLQNHERTHTGEKPFRCQVCDKRFTRDHHLKTHMRLHTGEKPYLCTHCDRQFVQVANLRRHLRVHTGERPYACTVCSAKFSDSNQLKAHMLIHKGVKPFGCDKCQNRFRRRHHLMHHKCSGKADSSTDIHKAERKSPESIIDTTANIMQSYCENIRQYAQMRSDVDFRSSQEDNSSVITRASRLMMRPMSELMADVERGIKMDDIENEDDALGMVVEEEEEGVDEHDLTSPDRNCLILTHNNNGSVLERKCRGRKPQEIRRVIRMPNSPSPSITSTQAPMIMSSPLTLPTAAHLPEQTEPEDLSMSTGHQHGYRNNNVHSNSHSSGDSPLSRSPSSGLEEEEEELDTNLPPSSLFLQHRHPKFRRHHEHIQRNNGAAPVS